MTAAQAEGDMVLPRKTLPEGEREFSLIGFRLRENPHTYDMCSQSVIKHFLKKWRGEKERDKENFSIKVGK